MKSLPDYWDSINLFSILLLPVSGLFCLLAKLRALFYKKGWLVSYRAPLPVIVVGNINVGGTGKTPLIIELVNQLQARGHKPGVISRGYGGKASSWPQQVTATSTAQQVGDEPVLIYQHCGCPMVVGPSRRDDIEQLLQLADCDVILSDDGMQHYALQRDLEIAVIDAQRQLGNGFCLPSGPLRETAARLLTVDLVLLNGGDSSQTSFKLIAGQCMPAGQTDLTSRALDDFKNTRVHAIAGIGHPQRFFSMLEKYGIEVIPHAFADHYEYQLDDLQFDDELPVLMTEKDAVKCRDFALSRHWSVPVAAELSETAQQQLDQLLQRML
jgi:tetraacyldisaccharide 4'-kinase